MTREEYFQEIARIHEEWVKDIRVEPDPRYANNDPSQYPENAETVSASPEDDARYWAQVMELTRRYREEHPLPPVP